MEIRVYFRAYITRLLPERLFFPFCNNNYIGLSFQHTWFLNNSSLYQKNLSVSSFFTKKMLIQDLGLTNTAFNKFFILWNKNIGFLLKYYHGFGEQYHIFQLRSLFSTFKSLKSVEFPVDTVV